MVMHQRAERQKLLQEQQVRSQREAQERSDRLNKGLRGLWDRLTGRHKRVLEENAVSAKEAEARDKREREHQTRRQMDERRKLQTNIQAVRDREKQTLADLLRDRERLTAAKEFEKAHLPQESRRRPDPVTNHPPQPKRSKLEAFKEMRRRQSEERRASREVGRNTALRGPEMER